MDFFKRTILGKRTTKRTYSSTTPTTPISPMPEVLNDVEEDEIDYSPTIQQEADGIRLQKIQRTMIEEKIKDLNQWSAEHKQWAKKFKRLLQTNNSSLQSYTTTVQLFQVTISLCDQITAQFDESSEELAEILREIPTHENPSVKSQLTQETSMIKKSKHELDALEKELRQMKHDLDQTQKNLRNSHLNTQKRNKLQEHHESLIQNRKKLKKQLQNQRKTYEQDQKQYRTNTGNIYQLCQEKELARLTNMPDTLQKFVTALKIDPTLLKEAIQKYDPKKDLTSWEEQHFSSSFRQTEV